MKNAIFPLFQLGSSLIALSTHWLNHSHRMSSYENIYIADGTTNIIHYTLCIYWLQLALSWRRAQKTEWGRIKTCEKFSRVMPFYSFYSGRLEGKDKPLAYFKQLKEKFFNSKSKRKSHKYFKILLYNVFMNIYRVANKKNQFCNIFRILRG